MSCDVTIFARVELTIEAIKLLYIKSKLSVYTHLFTMKIKIVGVSSQIQFNQCRIVLSKNKVWTDKQTDRHLNFKNSDGAKNWSFLCPRLPIHICEIGSVLTIAWCPHASVSKQRIRNCRGVGLFSFINKISKGSVE